MTARAFTDGWDGLQMYDTDWRLWDAGEMLRNAATYERLQRRGGILPERSLTVPHHILFEVTGACNLNCSFCYNASGEGAPGLTDQQLVDTIAQIVELDVLEVIVTGGEPLVRPNAVRATVETCEHFGIATHMLTNGLLLDGDWVQYLVDHGLLSIQVSVDGANPEAHDQVRGRDGSWRAAVDAVGRSANAGCYTIMAMVLTRQNYESLDDYLTLAFCLGADQVMVGDCMPRGRGVESINDVRISDEQYLEATELLHKRALEYEDLMQITLASDEALSLKMQLARMQTAMVLRADGSVVGSCLLPVELGNVLQSPLRTIWSESVANLATDPNVLDFVEPLRVRGVGEESLLRVDHKDFMDREETAE